MTGHHGAGLARTEAPAARRGAGDRLRSDSPGPGKSTPRRRSRWPEARTIAIGITVPKALGDFLVLRAVRETAGCAVAVTDESILDAQLRLARAEGAFICPEGAACVAAAERLRQSGWLAPDDEVVTFNTGTGLKYPATVDVQVPVLSKGDVIMPGHSQKGS